MNKFFPEIKKNFGFGCMRFPMAGDVVDEEQVMKMVDLFLEAGFNYFDTAKPYHGGNSESVVRRCLTSRYPRDSYVLTTKLSAGCFEGAEGVRPMFEDQLEACGVEYFDFYLFHALNAKRHELFVQQGIYDIARQLKVEGKIRHLGMSFHDSAEVLDKILTDLPDVEVVQLQLNYVDWIDPRVQSRECYEVCRKHGKPVIVMEPVKGGSLANLPEKAVAMMTSGTPASYALRFAAGPEDVVMVLSGMSNLEQVLDNLATMKDYRPLDEQELETIDKVRTIHQGLHKIPCTACRYCVEGCPAGLDIPALFACLNDKHQKVEGADERYAAMTVKADSCLECGKCESACPQYLHIRDLLKDVAAGF